MKNILTKFSVTKLVFLIMTIVLAFQTVYLTIKGEETKLFNDALLMIISFYYGQKIGKAQKDPLVDDTQTE